MYSVQSHTVLITVASQDLGRGLAQKYTESGQSVFGCACNASNFAFQNFGYNLAQEIIFDDISVNKFNLSCTDGLGMASNWREKSLPE